MAVVRLTYHEDGSRVSPISQIVEQTTPGFRRDWDRLNSGEQARVQEALQRTYQQLQDDPRRFFARARRPIEIHLKNGFNSSLYSLRAGRDTRVVMTVDDDPVFARTLVTLFRVVPHEELEYSYRSIARSLYGKQLEKSNGLR